MEKLEVTTLSTKGQVVIPQKIRDSLHVGTGSKFVVFSDGDTIYLKSLKKPSRKDFDNMIKKSRKLARERKLKKSDVEKTIREVRGK